MRTIRAAFTLVELMIVIVILGIMAMVVVPHYVSATNSSRGAALADQVRIFREAANVYRAQHMGQWPGIDQSGAIAGTSSLFVSQLTTYTDAKGAANPTKTAAYEYGPYLPSLPANPISGQKTVTIVTASGTPVPDDSSGWFYQPSTGKLWPNTTASDSDGKPYFEY